MPKDVLVRGIDDETVAYLEQYRLSRRSGRWWSKTSWSELIGLILREWVTERKERDEARLGEDVRSKQ